MRPTERKRRYWQKSIFPKREKPVRWKRTAHMEAMSRTVIDEDSYEENPNVTVREIPWTKQLVFDVVGLGVQMCRYLV
ncbi:MAG TPA: hypothetical protein IAB48_09335 [Candidatus Fimimorpha excrementavium]|nr:hypothetical protein [Candidatus Fimimorpha excrementavium]